MASHSASVLCSVDFPSLGIRCSSTLVELVVQDTHVTVQHLCQRLSKHLETLADARAGAVTVTVTELRWQGSTCDPGNSLDLYFGLLPRTPAAKQPTVILFAAHVRAVPAVTQCVLHISGSTCDGADPCVLDVGSPYITVAELRRRLAAAAPTLLAGAATDAQHNTCDFVEEQTWWRLATCGIPSCTFL